MGRKKKKKNSSKQPSPSKPAKTVDRGDAPATASVNQQRIGRVAAIILGVIFLLAGTLKVADPWSFLGSLPAYGIPTALRLPITLGMPTIEVVLGVMLLAGWRTR
ncbi:MAG: hypothetical protein PVJ51_05370, partial [Acidobacteriota bacterium]